MDKDIAAVVARVRERCQGADDGGWTVAIVDKRDARAICDFAERHMEAPADLVETVATLLARTDSESLHDDARAILTALAGRVIPDGHVAVPLEDLRLALNRGGTIDGLNAFGRLQAIAGSDVIG